MHPWPHADKWKGQQWRGRLQQLPLPQVCVLHYYLSVMSYRDQLWLTLDPTLQEVVVSVSQINKRRFSTRCKTVGEFQ